MCIPKYKQIILAFPRLELKESICVPFRLEWLFVKQAIKLTHVSKIKRWMLDMTNLRNDLIGMTSDSSKQLLQQHLIQKRTVHTADSSFLRSIRISFSFILRSSFLLLIFLFLHEHTLHNHGQRLKLVMSHFGEG